MLEEPPRHVLLGQLYRDLSQQLGGHTLHIQATHDLLLHLGIRLLLGLPRPLRLILGLPRPFAERLVTGGCHRTHALPKELEPQNGYARSASL